MIDLLVVGAGPHAKVCASVAQASGIYRVVGFVERPGVHASASPVLGDDSFLDAEFANGRRHVFVAIGDNRRRLEVAERLQSFGWTLPTLIHPSAVVDARATVGNGTLVAPGAIVNVDASIGFACIVNTAASVDHDCVVEAGCHVAPGARLCGTVHLGRASMIGAGAVVIPEIVIGEFAVVGAGAAVVSDIPASAVAVGVPARASFRLETKG
jgi:sugar O-acyltransferase (sialic acid O-acetyltransferase NeuD family)